MIPSYKLKDIPNVSLAQTRLEPNVATEWRVLSVDEIYYILEESGFMEIGASDLVYCASARRDLRRRRMKRGALEKAVWAGGKTRLRVKISKKSFEICLTYVNFGTWRAYLQRL